MADNSNESLVDNNGYKSDAYERLRTGNPTLISIMKIDVLTNEDSRVLVRHNKPFPALLEWAEYDTHTGNLTFVTKNGESYDFGMELTDQMKEDIKGATYLEALLMDGDKSIDYANVKLLVN